MLHVERLHDGVKDVLQSSLAGFKRDPADRQHAAVFEAFKAGPTAESPVRECRATRGVGRTASGFQ